MSVQLMQPTVNEIELTRLGVEETQLDLARLPQFLSLEVLLDQLLRSALQVRAVVRNVDGHEPVGEYHLSLAERNLALIETSGGLDRSKGTGEAVQSLGGTNNDIVSRSVVERNVDLRVLREVLVGLLDLNLEVGQSHSVDDHHVGGNTFTVLLGILDQLGLERDKREKLLSSKTEVEELSEGLEGVDVERIKRVRAGDRDGGDDSLRVTGSTLEPAPHFTGSQVRDLACDQVLHQLGESDQGHGEGNGSKVLDRRSRA